MLEIFCRDCGYVVLLNSATGLVLLGVSLAGLGLAPAFSTTIAPVIANFP